MQLFGVNMINNLLENAREAIQDDLLCVLDGMDQRTLDKVCQVIVDHFQELIARLNHGESKV